jgi:hypothetical protein
MPAKKSATEVFQFHIELRDIKPKIWRRIQVPDMTLNDLHDCIQTAMGWTNSHLHEFTIEGERYGDPEMFNDGFDDAFDDEHDTCIISLNTLLIRAKQSFCFDYVYDMGDHWEHLITFEGKSQGGPKAKYPCCIEGQRACPPEDCGGSRGYERFLKAWSNPKHAEHKSYRERVPGFDPEEFSVREATERMQEGLLDWPDELD